MARLIVEGVSPALIEALERRAAASGRTAETELHEILRTTLFGSMEEFAKRTAALRRQNRSSGDSSEIIRADRDRDGVA